MPAPDFTTVTEQLPTDALVTVLIAVVVSEFPGVITQVTPEELLAVNFNAPGPLPPETVKVISEVTAAVVASPSIVRALCDADVKESETAAADTGP